MDSTTAESASSVQANLTDVIDVQGVRVHNLKNIDLQIQRNQLTVVCGVSGSGKSSLVFDTLFAEGQRRYVETFSPYVRQFMDRIERPDADRIDGMPPAIAIRQNANVSNRFSTVGTRTAIYDSLRNLFATAGQLVCGQCQQVASVVTSDSATDWLISEYADRRAMLVFPATEDDVALTDPDLTQLLAQGYSRCIIDNTTVPIERLFDVPETNRNDVLIVADRIKLSAATTSRIAESIEATLTWTAGSLLVLVEETDQPLPSSVVNRTVVNRTVDGRRWTVRSIHRGLQCRTCDASFGQPTSESLNFMSAAGACPECEGTGQVSGMTLDKVVPNDQLSLSEGAIQPWTTPAYRHELDELLMLAQAFDIPTDRPFRELEQQHRQLIHDGVPKFHFGGLVGFHRWLVRNRYKKGVSVVLNRWRSWLPCPQCEGNRLKQTGASLSLQGKTITEVSMLQVSELQTWFHRVVDGFSEDQTKALRVICGQLNARIGFLVDSGLGYLSLDRTLRTLSGGEAQRVILTSALGSGLINTLYVLDEPTCGLHPEDSAKVLNTIRKLQQNGNTIVVVEHDPDFIAAADQVIEIGPAAGKTGGQVVFQGTPAELLQSTTATGKQLVAQTEINPRPTAIRTAEHWLAFKQIQCHNILGIDLEVPLGVICAFTGVSGSGKSSLVVDSIYPKLCRLLGKVSDTEALGSIKAVSGSEQISDVRLLDQSPVRATRRSIPATMLNCFDEIRNVLAATHEAKKRNYKPGMFSFNSAAGGRCDHCDGIGLVTVEMQFLADIQTTCEACSGKRFRQDVLEVRYRDRNIDDILNMTVEEAFTFFHNQKKIQQKLNSLRQAGLAYVRLGQPVSTLSGGEAQRLKIASLLAGIPLDGSAVDKKRQALEKSKGQRTLFILDEPSTGLHMQDVDLLMKCLNHLVEIGHTIWVIEHDLSVIRQSDYLVQLGPGAGSNGGKVVKKGDTDSFIKELK
ncbi:MAG: excinuclease ABC subunit UvrA [Fuerstiella sp.]